MRFSQKLPVRPRWSGHEGRALRLRDRPYAAWLDLQRRRAPRPVACAPGGRALYVSAVGAEGKTWLAETVARFGTAAFDYLILAYDDTRFDEPVFARCEVVRAKGMKWQLVHRHVPPARVAPYAFVFVWDDDLDPSAFDARAFLDVLEHNGLELAQPALTRDSHFSHPLTLQGDASVGRFTDFVEIMAPVFRADAWARFWPILDPAVNHWGWGLDLFARSLCGFRRMGIVDGQPVRHTRPIDPDRGQADELRRFRHRHPRARPARKLAYAELR